MVKLASIVNRLGEQDHTHSGTIRIASYLDWRYSQSQYWIDPHFQEGCLSLVSLGLFPEWSWLGLDLSLAPKINCHLAQAGKCSKISLSPENILLLYEYSFMSSRLLTVPLLNVNLESARTFIPKAHQLAKDNWQYHPNSEAIQGPHLLNRPSLFARWTVE